MRWETDDMANTNGEKIVELQTQMRDVQTDITEMKADIKEIKGFIVALNKSFVPRTEFEEFKRRRWAENTLSAVAGIALSTIVASVIYIILGR